MRRRVALLGPAGVVVFALIGLTPAWAGGASQNADSTQLSMAVRTVQLEPSRSESGQDSDSIEFYVSGPDAQLITIDLLDFVVSPDGTKSLLPAASTAHTLDGIVTIGTYEAEYLPDGGRQSFSAALTATEPGDTVRFGGVRVSMTPQSNDSTPESLGGTSGALMVVLVVPDGFDGDLPSIGETTLEASELKVRPLFGENFFETLLPDIPGVINRGPVAIDVDLVNQSLNPVFLDTRWVVSAGSDVVLSHSSDSGLLFAGQVSQQTVELVATVPGSTRAVNLLSSFDFVDVVMTSEGRLGGSILDSSEQSLSFLVLRWKEPVAIIACLVAVSIMLWRTRRTESPAIPERQMRE
jgi:nitrogen fixation-related uncharacterized protein